MTPKDAFIGPQLKAARKLRGIPTTQALAGMIDRAGFGWKVIGMVERNERKARDYEIAWLAEALDITVDELLREPGRGPSLEVRLDAIERALAEMRAERAREAEEVREVLGTQTDTLGDLKDTLKEIRAEQETLRGLIEQEKRATRETQAATQRLLGAVDVASRALRADVPRPAAKPGPPTK